MPKIVGKPRGRMSAYAFYLQISRQELKQKYPDVQMNFAEFSKKCSEKWKTLDDRAKERFVHLAEHDKERFKLEMAAYAPTGKDGKGGKVKRAKRDENAPKRALSAFFWFCHDERADAKAAVGHLSSVGDVAKELGRRWGMVTPEGKHRYDLLAAKDKQRYEKEMQAYKQQIADTSRAPNMVPSNHISLMQEQDANVFGDDNQENQ